MSLSKESHNNNSIPETKLNNDGTPNTKYVDLLDEDKPIAGQKFVCLSFISPEKIIKNKELFMFESFIKQWDFTKTITKYREFFSYISYKYNLKLDNVMEDYEDFCKTEKEKLKKTELEDDFKNFIDVNLDHMLADNCAMQLVRNPKQFDVILTDNLFGDLLSDIAAMLTGSLGMLPSASLGTMDEYGKRAAMYEPVHGSAPDIAGQGKANPLAMIMSFAMMLKYSFNMNEDSSLIERSVQNVLSKGLRTADIKQGSENAISTQDMGKAVIQELSILSGK